MTLHDATHLDYPFDIDGRGRSATTTPNDHVRDMIYQVLFTAPGERVNRPDFGCGLLQLVFEPNSDLVAGATELLVRSGLQRWLSDVVDVHDVNIRNDDSRLVVTVVYSRLLDGTQLTDEFEVARGQVPA